MSPSGSLDPVPFSVTVARQVAPADAIWSGPALAVGGLLTRVTNVTALLALFMGYGSLVDVSNVALFAQFIPTSLAVIALRISRPEMPRLYRLPGGPTIPLIATLGSITLLWAARPKVDELWFAVQIVAAGCLVWALTVVMRKNRLDSSPRGSTNA